MPIPASTSHVTAIDACCGELEADAGEATWSFGAGIEVVLAPPSVVGRVKVPRTMTALTNPASARRNLTDVLKSDGDVVLLRPLNMNTDPFENVV